jgi:hypothetical protein
LGGISALVRQLLLLLLVVLAAAEIKWREDSQG